MSLTPIHESEEEGQNLSVNTDSCIEEHNNSSVIPKHVSESVCGSVSADKESSSKEKKVVIESCSGRKIEDVEVLKQKYINSQIQDLPRVIRGPFGQDRIWRTRRRSLNLGSQDIRNQLSKISLKMDGDMKLDYRCKKYTDPSDKALGIKKSVEEILYGNSYNPDDYDPELAALFENYIEECDNVTKKHFSANPTTCAANNEETIFKNQDAERAFLCGFIEGMKRTDGSLEELEQENPVHGNELIDYSVMKSESFKELVSVKESASLKELDSVKKSASFNELISSQQDITHMSLREWEDVQRAEEQQKENNRRQLIKKCLACKNKKPREIKNISDNMKSVPTVEGDCKDTGKNKILDSNVFTEALHSLKAMKRIKDMKKRVENVTDDERHNDVIKEDDDDSYIVKGSVVKDTLSCHHCCKYLKPNLERTTLSPSMGEKSVLKNKHRVADLNNLSKEDDSMIKLAKQKLEHSLLTTRALEETYLSMAKAKKIINDCKPAGHWKDRNESNENKTSISNVEAKGIHTGTIILDELEGWKTKNKAFIDQESVQVSSSELLHPVESSEMLGSPLWTPASSASHFKSTPEINRAMSPAHTRAYTSSDEENKVVRTTIQGGKSYKPRKMGVQGDYKKAAKLVKLRLTKSSDTTADKSFANVPLSQCINYNIEKNLRSNAVLTSNINLSEKLAQQLKEMSNDPKTSALHHGENKPDASTEAINLPPLSDSTLSLNEPKSTNGKVEENVNNLPDIHTTSTNENGPAIPRQLGQDHNVSEQSNSEFHDLPHISIKSFPNKAPRKESSKTAKIQDEEGDQLNRGAAVRAATCTSPYMFDKSDPQKLQLKARPLPSLHKVCTSCGGISACQERTGKQKRKSKHNEKETKSKVNHVRCCKSYVQDKWKLDGGKYGHSLKCSSIGIDKPTNRPRDLEQKQLQKPQLILSPTKTRPKCEEMSIDFMDKSIKFRFQCDVSVENNGQDEEVQTVDKAGKWLNNISTPTCKDCYQCPIATETRIYKDKVKGDNYGRETTPQPPPSSPYLDYCKSKAKMIAKKKEQFSDHIVYLSDTCLTEDVYMKAAKKIKRFPVIPKKKSKDNLRAIKRQTSNVVNSGSPRPGSDIDLNMKSTKPARLRGMKTSPYNISKENCNNNGQTQTLFHDDSKHYYCQEDHC